MAIYALLLCKILCTEDLVVQIFVYFHLCANDDEAVCILLQICRELVSLIFRLPQISAAPREEEGITSRSAKFTPRGFPPNSQIKG